MSALTEVVRRFHEELWGSGDISAIDRHVAPDAVTVMTGFEGSTIDVLREDVDRYVGAFHRRATEIVDLIAQGDRVAIWWRTSGPTSGPTATSPPTPTGERITMEGVDFLTVRRRAHRRGAQLLGRRRGLPPVRPARRRPLITRSREHRMVHTPLLRERADHSGARAPTGDTNPLTASMSARRSPERWRRKAKRTRGSSTWSAWRRSMSNGPARSMRPRATRWPKRSFRSASWASVGLCCRRSTRLSPT